MSEYKITVVDKKNTIINYLKDKITALEKRIRELEKKLDLKNTELSKSEKKCRQAIDDKEMLRQRLMKIKTSKSSSMSLKICKNCSREYYESENFNWSCRTHRASDSVEWTVAVVFSMEV